MPQHAVIDPSVVIRAARGSDGTALENLARMDSQRPVAGSVLLGDRAIADPFRPTADLVELLRLHAARTSHAGGDRSRVRVPRLRAA